MDLQISHCRDHFGHESFNAERLVPKKIAQCPVKGCNAPLAKVPFRKSELPYCSVHGIRLHSNTFVYWNGAGRDDEARLRNFVIRPDLAQQVALGSTDKAESHRLGYEMSEDALTWNVFVGLAEAGKLRDAAAYLTGRTVRREPQLYLWGERVNLQGGSSERFAPLNEVRSRLEKDIRHFKTEPDAMLVAEGELLVCIEAKFGSGNPLAHAGSVADGEKPIEREQLLRRYLDKASDRTRRNILRDATSVKFHSQLFRNLVFASEMALDGEWHVVSLMSDTQRTFGRDSEEYSFADPTSDIQAHLVTGSQKSFTYRSWEGLYRELVYGQPKLEALNSYMVGKSAHYIPAFRMSSG